MKLLFIEARKKQESSFDKISNIDEIRKLGNIHILYSIQYKALAEIIRKKLKSKVKAFQQVLGCSKIKPKANLLLIGSGKFHALQLALQTGKEVYIYDGNLSKITNKDIEKEKKREKGKILKFLNEKNIAILVSLKPGQFQMKKALMLKEKLKSKGKNAFIFICDNININELENFPCFFINTACPGISIDSDKLINYESLKEVF